jgi:cytochrome c
MKNRIKVALLVSIASVALGGIAGCSKPKEEPSSDQSASAANTTESANTTETAQANTATESETNTTAPSATMIPLQIKDDSGATVSGDPVEGKEVFQQCATCHSIEPGVNKVGPSLHGIIGRHSGIAPNFNYSTANKSSGIVWTEQNIYKYLNNPQAMVPGTYMTFTGVPDLQKRADVIAYLQENTK